MRLTVLLIVVALMMTSKTAVAAERRPAPDGAAAGDGANAFATELYKQVAAGDEPRNVFFSPASVHVALAMTSLGARTETEKQMLAVLGYDVADKAKLHEASAALMKRLNGEGAERPYQLAVANRLWGQAGFNFLPGFLNEAKGTYGAPLEQVDFVRNLEGSRAAINQWVEKQTADKIKELIKPGMVTSDARLVLTNAIYFKGSWAEPFAKDATKDEPFAAAGGKSVTVPMMHRKGRYAYAEDDAAQVVEIPYAGNDLAMLVILPREKDGLAAVEKALDAKWLADRVGRLERRSVDLSMPRFTMKAEFQLQRVLAAMGMPLAFDQGKADFSGMTTEDRLAISKVIHQAFVDVNEAGTEAAAATAVTMTRMSAVVPQLPVAFRADRPFLVAIRDVKSGSVLFLGRVVDPKS